MNLQSIKHGFTKVCTLWAVFFIIVAAVALVGGLIYIVIYTLINAPLVLLGCVLWGMLMYGLDQIVRGKD